ncbi:hypothetical protein ACR820_03135 [Streptomyces netropsis]
MPEASPCTLGAGPELAVATRSRHGLGAPLAGSIPPLVRVTRIRWQAALMYVLIIPASVPFVLLATVMGLSWWEDHVLPPADPAETAAEGPSRTPPVAFPEPERASIASSLTGSGSGR